MKKENVNWLTADGINNCNKALLFCAALLLIIGVIFVFEADRHVLSPGMSKGIQQIIWAVAGLMSAVFFLLINYKKLASETILKFFLWFLIGLLILLSGTAFINLFTEHNFRWGIPGLFDIRRINGAYRWIIFGFGSIQPATFIQVVLVLFLAVKLSKTSDVQPQNYTIPPMAKKRHVLATPPKNMQNQRKKAKSQEENWLLTILEKIGNTYISDFFAMIKSYWIPLLIAILVFVQPSTSVALSVLVTTFAMIMLKSPKEIFRKGLVIFFVFGAIFAVAFYSTNPHVQRRIANLGDGETHQQVQARLAVGSGGLFGLGLGQSEAKHGRIPEIENDFIFALIAEETGFLGSIVFIGIYALFIIAGFLTAIRAQDNFGRLAAFGFTVNYAFSFLLHLFVNLGFISTGAGLPFVSYGGTAMIADCIALGILLNISGAKYERIRR